MPPPVALMRARCRACSDVIVGPSVVCDICLTDVHSHCMQPWHGHAVCFACFTDRDIAHDRRQAAWSSGLAGQLGRTVASGAQMASHAVGATISTAATGVQRLAIGAALPDQLLAAAVESTGRADAPDMSQDQQRPPAVAMDLHLAELRELRMEVQRLSRRNEQLEAERRAAEQRPVDSPLLVGEWRQRVLHHHRCLVRRAPRLRAASTARPRRWLRPSPVSGSPRQTPTRSLQRRPRTKQQSHLAEFRCLALRRQPALAACLSRRCSPVGCRPGCLRPALGPMDGRAGLQADRQEDAEVVEMEEVLEDILEVEVILGVIQGVARGCLQLAAVLAKLKDGDVPKLAFAAGVNKAHAFEEWVQRAAMRIGGWHPLVDLFWQRSERAAREAYEYYLSRGPLERPLVKPNTEWLGADRQSLSIELRLRPLLLDAVPEQVQRGALATRQTSVTERLFSIMVEAGPGTLRDRKLVLREVERRDNKAAALAFCYQELNSWKFSLTRLQRLGMAARDPVTQLATLRGIVKGMAEADANFQYRMFAWEMQHGISGASHCSQQQVDEFWRHLAAEARELCDAPQGKGVKALAAAWEAKDAKGGGKQGRPDAKGGKPDARAEAKVRAKAKPADKAATGGKEACWFFDSKAGCKFGVTCTRHHRKLEVSEGRCFNCGAEDHDKAVCQRPKPPAAAAAGGASAASAIAVAPATAPTAEAMQQVVRDAVAASLYPISAAAAAAGRRRLLADTGATHELQHLWPNQHPPVPCQRIDLARATGQQAGVLMGTDEVAHVHSPTELQALFPIGAYVAELGLDLRRGRDRARVMLPGQGAIELELEGTAAYIYEDDAQRLRTMRQQLRARAGAKMLAAHFDVVVAAAQRLSLEEHKRRGHPSFRPDCYECRLAAGRVRAHWRLDARTRLGDQLSADISGERPGEQLEQAAAAAAEQPLAADDALAVVTRASALPAVAAVPADGLVEKEGVQTWYYVIPLAGKHTVEVLAALRLMIAQVELEFQARVVYRVHADQARELSGPKVSAALATQGIVVTSTPGHEADNNPRAERGIGIIKQRARAMLAVGAADREQLWPAAVVHAAALQRRAAQGKPIGCPICGQPITCRIKQVPQFAFAPRAVPRQIFGICDFVSGASLVGHKVAQNGVERWEFETSSSFVVDAVPAAAAAAAGSDSDGTPDFVEIIKDSGMQPVSMTELRNAIGTEREEWKQAMEVELASFSEKQVFEALTEGEKPQVRAKDALPMKGVAGIKAPAASDPAQRRRKKFRGVVCGNFQKQMPGEVVFTSNVEILSVKAALAIASSCGWALKALDVSTAFLNAPLPEEAGEVLVRPPGILSSHGLVGRDEIWRAKKGIYGLRIAPRVWGLKRDRQMRAMRFEVNGTRCRLIQSRCDAPVWSAVEDVPTKTESEQKSLGLVLVYVDDFLISGSPETITTVEEVMMATWTCSVKFLIDRAHPGTIRYLGLEVEARANRAFVAHQAAYLEDVLARWQMTNANACGTISIEPLGEELGAEPELGDARLAQKLGGGLLWLSGRTRPDIAFAAVRGDGNEIELHVFAHANFEAEYSQTGVGVYLGECLIDWRSVKQAQVARSTAEAEITALAMGLVMLEGAEASLASIMVQVPLPRMWGDNVASLCLARGQGSWRTRALTNRASALRSRVESETLLLDHVGSNEQRADGLTKVFSVPAMAWISDHFGLRAV
ncbi:unnamed protein product [Prorocentrum cordatum]|uniref:C3H1-type domain-containing protein n=1 Tax=Prorocentrum cordatum TaxID=2364126 RepID=A0ABN9TI44_9DINO|nr:unnamed protein product [Polarella glacialis]